jgi:phage terminase large subunit-like protein
MSAPEKWSTACLDWEERIVAGKSLIALEPLFPENAKEALEIFDSLRMVDAAGAPYMSEISRQWLRDFVAQIFGSYDSETGIRHITEFFLLISKKNGKSTDAAAIMVVILILNWRLSSEFIILAPTVEIAGNSFKPAADMVRIDPELSDLLLVQDHIRTITHRTTGATLKVVAADTDTVGGKKAAVVLIDELWLFGKRVNAPDMLREATGGLTSRPEGCIIYLSTQSNEPPTGVFKSKLEYARGVRDGLIDDNRFLPVLYEFPKYMLIEQMPGSPGLYRDPKNFYITNPNMGASVNEDYLLREYKKAQESHDPAELIGFFAKHLNIEIGMNLQADRWPGADFWVQGELMRPVTIDTLIKECEVITAGIDGGGLDDLLGAAAVGRCKKSERVLVPEYRDPETGELFPEQWRDVVPWLVWSYAWAHPSVLKRRLDIASKLQDFAKAGEMSLVRIIGEDTAQLSAFIAKIELSGLLFQVGLDPAAIGGILDALILAGVPEEKMVTVNQGWRLAGAIKTTERKLAECVLKHGGTSLMNWCVGNAKVKVSGNAIVITKQVSGTAKIDPLMALFNAVSLMALNPPAQAGAFDFSLMTIGG